MGISYFEHLNLFSISILVFRILHRNSVTSVYSVAITLRVLRDLRGNQKPLCDPCVLRG